MVHDQSSATLFPTLSPEALDRLRAVGEELTFADGDEVLAEGTPNYPFFAVLEGHVRMTKRIGAERQLLAVHGPGHFIGEISMLSGLPVQPAATPSATSR